MGELIKSPLYWAGRIKQALKGQLDPKELQKESVKELKDRGLIYNNLLGWVYKAELEEADNPTLGVPCEGEKVSPKFLRYMVTKKIEAARTDKERKMIQAVQSLFENTEEVGDRPF